MMGNSTHLDNIGELRDCECEACPGEHVLREDRCVLCLGLMGTQWCVYVGGECRSELLEARKREDEQELGSVENRK